MARRAAALRRRWRAARGRERRSRRRRGARQSAGQGKSGERLAQWATGAGRFRNRTAEQQRGPHLCTAQRRERDARAARYGKAHGDIRALCARRGRRARKDVGRGGWRGSEALPRGIRRMVCEFGTRCGQLWKPQAPRNRAGHIFARHQTGARCTSNPMWQGARRDQSVVSNNAPRGRGRRARRRLGAARTASQQGVAGGESGEQFANSARAAGSFGSCGATQQRGPRPYTAHDGSETHEQRYVARRAASSQRRPEQHAVRPRAADAKKTWGRVAGRAARRCRRRIGRTVWEFGTRRGQLWKPRRGATARAACLHGARREQSSRATRCARRTEISQRPAHERTVRPQATDAKKAWGREAGRAARRCKRIIKRTI